MFLGLQASCSPEAPPDERVQAAAPKLVAERVTATVEREATLLVRMQMEHGALLTTPEHPVATLRSGWIPAGRLAAGDWVVSVRFGTAPVLSVRHEQLEASQRVFNLQVEPSHAYVVGADQVLVHNTKCKDPAEREREIAEAERALDELRQQRLVAAAEDKLALQQQIAQAAEHLSKLKNRANVARSHQKNAGQKPALLPVSEARRSRGIARSTRAVEALDAAIAAIEAGTTLASPQRLAELRQERRRIRRNLTFQLSKDKLTRGLRLPLRGRLLRDAEAAYESAKAELGAAQRRLSEPLGEEPQSGAEGKSQAERRAELEKRIQSLQFEQHASKEILDGERRLAELAAHLPATDAEQEAIQEEQRELAVALAKKRKAQRDRQAAQRRRQDAEARARRLQRERASRDRTLRTAAYLADTERPRDTLELLEADLAARQEGGSADWDEKNEYLVERIATLKEIVTLNLERERLKHTLRRRRERRARRSLAQQDTGAIDQDIARLERERTALKVQSVQLRLREAVLGKLDGTTSMDALSETDQVRLCALERELEGELAAGGALPEERLREIERELGETELIDAEFLEGIWREGEAGEAAIPERVQGEPDDVDALLRELAESLKKSPSPERTAAAETGLLALQRELREERSRVEAADIVLASEQAFSSQASDRPGSSHDAADAQRLAEVQQQRLQLRSDWRERMQRRLDAARQDLRAIQGVERLRDEAAEAELARQIALLEHEVNAPAF